MGEWYFGIDVKEIIAMREKATFLAPKNPLYQWDFYKNNDDFDCINRILQNKNAMNQIHSKGLLGKYLFGMLKNEK